MYPVLPHHRVTLYTIVYTCQGFSSTARGLPAAHIGRGWKSPPAADLARAFHLDLLFAESTFPWISPSLDSHGLGKCAVSRK